MCYFKGKEVDIYKIIMLDTTLKLSSELQMHPILKNKPEEFSEHSSESIRNWSSDTARKEQWWGWNPKSTCFPARVV